MTMPAVSEKAASRSGHQRDMASWLGLAAAPAFASMAWLSAIGAQAMVMCSSHASFVSINDMCLMYLLMSLFHLPPWLKVVSGLSRDKHTTQTEGN